MSDQPTVHEPADSDGMPSVSPATTYEPGHHGASALTGRRRVNPPESITTHYEYLDDVSSRGAQADVIRCRDRRSSDIVVVKLFREAVVALDPVVLEELRNADERHVARVLDFHIGADAYEVQRYFPLGSVHDWFATPGVLPLSQTLATAVLHELALAVDHIHRRGIVHRDIKPANVMVRSFAPLDLVLTDFGVARSQAVTRMLRSMAGTTAYMAPESIERQCGRAGDWWAVGLIVLEALAGQHLHGDGEGGLLPDHVIRLMLNQGTYVVPDLGDDRWTTLVRGLLTQQEQQRFGSEEVLMWLRGENPSLGTTTLVTEDILPFSGIEISSPAQLLRELRVHEDEAWRVLGTGAPSERSHLIDWLIGQGVPAGKALSLSRDELGSGSPAAKSARLQLMLDPSSAPVYRTRVLDAEGLLTAASAAIGGDVEAGSWITSLRADGVLLELARQRVNGMSLAVVGDNLHRWWRHVTADAVWSRPGVREQASVLEGLFLRAAVDPAVAASASAAATQAAQDREGVAPWALEFTASALEADGASRVGLQLIVPVVLELGRQDERIRRRSEEQRREEADRARRSAAALRLASPHPRSKQLLVLLIFGYACLPVAAYVIYAATQIIRNPEGWSVTRVKIALVGAIAEIILFAFVSWLTSGGG